VPFEENQERDRKKDKKLVAAAAPMHDPKAAASSPLELTKRRVSSSDLPAASNGLHKMARDQRSHGIAAGNPKKSHSDKIFSTDGNSERGGGENPSPSLCDVSSAAAGGGGKIFTVTPEGGMKTVKNFSGELIQIENAAACGLQGGGLSHVAGILYKWVNLGKGWRPRWCILQEGVFSYYKIHGPDKVTVSQERYKTFQLIGDDAERLMKKHRPHHHVSSDEKNSAKVTGEVHLKVLLFFLSYQSTTTSLCSHCHSSVAKLLLDGWKGSPSKFAIFHVVNKLTVQLAFCSWLKTCNPFGWSSPTLKRRQIHQLNVERWSM
jgi:hypothetical protein